MLLTLFSFFFFFNDTATTEIYTLSLHDALPISLRPERLRPREGSVRRGARRRRGAAALRLSTRRVGSQHGARDPAGVAGVRRLPPQPPPGTGEDTTGIPPPF